MNKKDTSWGKVADWYSDYLGNEDTFQAQVILPNLVRVVSPKPGQKILDLACGQGFFAREFAKLGVKVVGADISPELIAEARKEGGDIVYHVAPAHQLRFAKDAEFDVVLCVLALQNIEDLSGVYKEVARVLKPGGKLVMVINHPTFRVLKRSSWGWDEQESMQYRRIDGYLSSAKILVDMHPGQGMVPGGGGKSVQTISYHRSLQDFFKALSTASFAVTRLEEWISHRSSEKGPRQKAEDTARKEIPIFMMLEARR